MAPFIRLGAGPLGQGLPRSDPRRAPPPRALADDGQPRSARPGGQEGVLVGLLRVGLDQHAGGREVAGHPQRQLVGQPLELTRHGAVTPPRGARWGSAARGPAPAPGAGHRPGATRSRVRGLPRSGRPCPDLPCLPGFRLCPTRSPGLLPTTQSATSFTPRCEREPALPAHAGD